MKRHTDDFDYLFKIIVVGNAAVGKTALLNKLVSNEALGKYMATIGVDFKVITHRIDTALIKSQIWDTSGLERFRSITSHYYRGAHAVVIVYDVSNEESFKNTQFWIDEVQNHGKADLVKILIGNKSDVPEVERAISEEKGVELANEYGMSFFETSAASGTNVKEAFKHVVEETYTLQKSREKIEQSIPEPEKNPHLKETSRQSLSTVSVSPSRSDYRHRIRYGCCQT